MSLNIKLITGFREDQYQTISVEEAHKAYYLFTHPEERGVFSNGVAIIGKNIQAIEPDFQSSMGWNPTHQLDSDDWNQITDSGTSRKIYDKLLKAKDVARLSENNPQIFSKPLSEINVDELEESKFNRLN